MYQRTVVAGEIEPTALDIPGTTMRVLHTDDATGAITVLTHLAPGAAIPEHWHTHADETVYVPAGDFIEGGVPYEPGTFFVGQAGTPHGPHSTTQGCTVLTCFSAPLDFQLVEQPGKGG